MISIIWKISSHDLFTSVRTGDGENAKWGELKTDVKFPPLLTEKTEKYAEKITTPTEQEKYTEKKEEVKTEDQREDLDLEPSEGETTSESKVSLLMIQCCHFKIPNLGGG